MLEKMFVKKYTLEDCQICKEDIEKELKLTATRLERLHKTRDRNPKWSTFDKYADEAISIDTHIEIQQATQEDLLKDLELLADREDTIKQEAALASRRQRIEAEGFQTSLFGVELC